MSETLQRLASIAPTILLLFILGLLMPKLVRREIFFGVRIPADRIKMDPVKKISAWYRNYYLLLAGTISALLLVLCYVNASPVPIFIGILGLILIQFGLYIQAREKALKLKQDEGWFAGKTETVVVETSFHGRPLLVSPWWFLLPVAIIVLDVALGIKTFPNLPEQIPVHFDQLGRPNRWSDKSIWSFFALPLNLVWVTALMFFVYRIIGWSKQELRADEPDVALAQQRTFRKRWSGFIVFLNIMICGLMSFSFLQTLQMIHPNPALMMGVSVGFTIVILGVTLILAFQTGQGGSRIRVTEKSGKAGITDRNDDRYWKWGLIYYNPDDPAMFVEKRFGVGWTNNFANWKANAIFIALILFLILVSLIVPK